MDTDYPSRHEDRMLSILDLKVLVEKRERGKQRESHCSEKMLLLNGANKNHESPRIYSHAYVIYETLLALMQIWAYGLKALMNICDVFHK